MCCGGTRTLFTTAPEAATDPSHPPILVDENGRPYVRLADRLSSANDSVTVERGSNFSFGTHNNAWAGGVVAAGSTSNAVDTGSCPYVSVMIQSTGATGITVQISDDGINFYDFTAIALGGAETQARSYTLGAKFVRLKTDTAVSLFATISGKG